MDRGTCSSCDAPILWVETERGNVMPLDEKPVPNGNVVIVEGKARVLLGGLFEPKVADVPRYQPHFTSCPNAEHHRRKRGRK